MNISEREPCKICGSTEIDLIDGFYYCSECGTQDENIRETMIEFAIVADKTTGLTTKKRLTIDPGKKKPKSPSARVPAGLSRGGAQSACCRGPRTYVLKMDVITSETRKQHTRITLPDGWYKWHSMNFLLHGLADELIECGAEPSVKTKVLWVWTRYMKKFQKKADFGLEIKEDDDVPEKDQQNDLDNESDSSTDNEDEQDMLRRKKNKTFLKEESVLIDKISMILVISILYVSLNLDRSQIQLSHLFRFIKDGRVSIIGWVKHVPKDLRPRGLKHCLLIKTSWLQYSIARIRRLGIQLFKQLDLGTPLVPDLRPMIENYMNELCLPRELIPLVHSVMRYRAFEYLDVHLHKCKRMPSYELYVIAHILFVFKLCFGIDGEYETRISDAVDKINAKEDHPRSYNSGATGRLFSFQEWLKFILFRRSQLWSHTSLLGAPHYSDMNDYVVGEHQDFLPDQDNEKNLRTQITWDLLDKMPPSEVNVIPKSEFPPTLTPYTAYLRVVGDHNQDPAIKRACTEDFTQYSVSYIFEGLQLLDIESENPHSVLTGVDPANFTITSKKFVIENVNKPLTFNTKMVYVKDCENHNWMTTMRPTVDHVTADRNTNEHEGDVKEDGSNDDDMQSITTIDINDLTTKTETDAQEFVFHLKDNNNTALYNQMLDSYNIREHGPARNDNKYGTASDIQSLTTVDINELLTLNEIKSESESRIDKDTDSNSNIADNDTIMDINSISDSQIEPPNKEENLDIREEDEGVSIFDDNFEETKKEIFDDDNIPDCMETNPPEEHEAIFSGVEMVGPNDRYNIGTQEYYEGRNSDDSSNDSVHITPETLDRKAAIKELVIHACQKYRVSLPGQYIVTKRRNNGKYKPGIKRTYVAKGVIIELVNDLINDYNTKIQQDVLFQMSNVVQSAIADFNQTQPPMEVDEPAVESNVERNEPNDVLVEDTISDSRIDDNTEHRHKLFDDESDGETHAEELLPKKNPEFDEKTHDPSQLYIEPAENIEAPELKLKNSLFKVIDETINRDVDRPRSPAPERSDEEDNLPLNVLQELKLIKNTLTNLSPALDKRTRCSFIPIIRSIKSVPNTPYLYWTRDYKTVKSIFGMQSKENNFGKELKKFPDTFVTVLKEFSNVAGHSPFNVYRSLLRVELCLHHKYVKHWNLFAPKYTTRLNSGMTSGTYLPS